MKRYIASIAILLFFGTFSWGQGTKDPLTSINPGKSLESNLVFFFFWGGGVCFFFFFFCYLFHQYILHDFIRN